MVGIGASRGRRVRRYALGTSAITLAIVLADPAAAQCAPDPTVPGGTTTCTGTDSDGLTIATSNSRVVVAAEASVRPGAADAAIVASGLNMQISVAGLVDGVTKPGLFVTTGVPYPVPCDPYAGASVIVCPPGPVMAYPWASGTLDVLAGGTVTGTQGVLLRRDPTNTSGVIDLSIVNAGTITGTAGEAILADQVGSGGVTLRNAATGRVVGGIAGSIFHVENAGTIDGTSRAAIAATQTNLTIVNTGRIVSNGTPATIDSGGYLSISNAAGATIANDGSGGSSTAVSTTGALMLTNNGTIKGSVVSTAAAGQSSTIDTRTGTIDGDLRLGAGDDLLRTRIDLPTGGITSITGVVDGGAGTDTLAIGIDADTLIARALLPTNFELLALDLSNNAVVTLAPGFTSPSGLALAGSGAVLLQTALVTSGPAVTAGYGITFTNQGTITATYNNPNLFAVATPGKVTNTGAITAVGGAGVSASALLANSGSITATGTAAALDLRGTLLNSGTIRSTAGTAVSFSSSTDTPSTNSGAISGATVGLTLSGGRFINSGTIAGGTSGVTLSGSTLVNTAAGGITGGVANGGGGGRLVNAGSITGNVDFTSPLAYDFSGDLFVDDGGSVSGAIRLGGGNDELVVRLGGDPARPLAGAAGGVDAGAGYDILRTLVDADAGVALTLANGFEGLAYELSNDAALTLTAASPITTSIGLAGNGTVTLNGAISGADRTLVNATIYTVDQLTGAGAGPAPDLTIVNNGTLALSVGPQAFSSNIAAIHSGADITNNGSIIVTNAAGISSPAGAVLFGGRLLNTGTIAVSSGGTAIGYVSDVTNAGDIIATGATAYMQAVGLSNVETVVNSGTIRADGTAVQSGYYSLRSLTNSGTIESRFGTAVVAGYDATIVNEATGTIRGGTAAIVLDYATIINRGAIVGDVTAAFAYNSSRYVADGGTLTGDLLFGSGDDSVIFFGETAGVSGLIDGGQGIDTVIQARRASSTVTLGALATGGAFTGFEREGVRAVGADTVVTIAAPAPYTGDVLISGDGTIVNTAAITGRVATEPLYQRDPTTEAFTTLAFTNMGTIANRGTLSAVSLQSAVARTVTAVNSGTIDGGIDLYLEQYPPVTAPVQLAGTLTNSGTISASGTAAAVNIDLSGGVTGSATLTNTGTIASTGPGGVGTSFAFYDYAGQPGTGSIAITNAGTIAANGGGVERTYTDYWTGETFRYTDAAIGLQLQAPAGATATVDNGGTIEATGAGSAAILSYDATLDLTNSGTIRGGSGTALADDDQLAVWIGAPFLAGAIQTTGAGDDRIINTGAIIGSVALGAGDDRIENYGSITGDVFLGLGNDTFLHRASAILTGTVDGGIGTDSLIIDATGGGAVNGDQFINFELFSQIGSGDVTYSGTFRSDTIGVSGGTISVAAGQTLGSAGAVTITGSDTDETLDNRGTIAGGVDLAGGNDRVENRGTIAGRLALGAGDDSFADYAGSSVASVDGGSGTDRYRVILTGSRTGIARHSGFEQLAVEGSGTLTLALEQSFEQVTLTGTGLNLSLGGFTVGQVTGSDAAETLAVDGDLAAVALGGGNDVLALGAARAAGRYDGGAGSDTLRFTAAGPVTLAGTATGFEQIALDGAALTITGTLGGGAASARSSAGAPLAFGDGAQMVTVTRGGTLAGAIDLGAGDDTLRLAAGATLAGTVSGGAGNDSAMLELAGDRTLASGILTDFELLTTEGTGTLSLTGAQAYQRIDAGTDVAVGAGAALSAGQVRFGTRDDRFTIGGSFTGSVDGGAGSDTIAVTGGSATITGVSNVERYVQSGGSATFSGASALGIVDMSSGTLVGLAGSAITASRITVGRDATFGSAGGVTGDLAIAGTLSPGGAGIGTMTVTGNVALAAGALSLFELAATGGDRLQVDGTVAIAPGATLQLVPLGTLRPGTSYDLVVASGGISGSYTNVVKPDSVFGLIVQRADRIQLLGQFLGGAGFSPQVGRSIAYANTALQTQPAGSGLFAAVPALLDANGASSARAFAQLTPEAYASATQAGVDNALTLAAAARGPAFATLREDAGLFTFAQGVGQWHTLGADRDQGTAAARTRGYGFLGGIGYGDTTFAVGAFGGWLDMRQTVGALGAETRNDGFVAGVHARYASGDLGLTASVLYDGGEARTTRALPGSATPARGRYDLHSWVADVSIGYAIDMGSEWALRPRAGVTYLRTTRGDVIESGGPFALTVARDRHVAGFVDGGVMVGRSDASPAPFRPFVALGVRYQIEGRRSDALAGYAGGPLGLAAFGATRARAVGTASAGVSYRLAGGLDLFSTASAQTGRDDHQETISTGVRLRF